jgi:hypothetical protein
LHSVRTKINLQAGDEGGELDPHGATGLGNPVGGNVSPGSLNPKRCGPVADWFLVIYLILDLCLSGHQQPHRLGPLLRGVDELCRLRLVLHPVRRFDCASCLSTGIDLRVRLSRICTDANGTYSAAEMCQHTLDLMGCQFVMPGDYTEGTFTSCDGDAAYPPGKWRSRSTS